MVVGRTERPFAVAGCTIANGRIVALDVIIDPEKIASVRVG
jgi:hypothetical protein